MKTSDLDSRQQYDLIVIGGGASGMMAAGVAAREGQKVLLIEKNARLGEKLRITGGGRCNIVNAEEDMRTLLSHYGQNGRSLFSAFSRFGMQDSLNYFAGIGIKVKIEDRKRAFPLSESAPDVVAALESVLNENDVTVLSGASVQKVTFDNQNISSVVVNGASYTAKSYVIATGGVSWPETGSTGDGFAWLEALGHTVREPTPNVTPLAVAEEWVKEVSGTSLEGVNTMFYLGDVPSFKVYGSVLFTHFGLSGPTILNNAYRVAELLDQGPVVAKIDCFPKKDNKELDADIRQAIEAHPAKRLKNTLRFVAPPGLSGLLALLLAEKLDLNISNSELSKDGRTIIVKLLKELPLTITGLMGFDKAIVADGGVSLAEIDTRTMKSRLINNLYVTGDMLDINRPSGGYSLQLCWTTGYLAGLDAASS